ncbi:hypothetical protein CAEBREN_03241 [Caenorhabditis brenneri]|uniref:Uncharacterized protein n=1 Tax=Caenorhabditis brenneri TaxID=135651 RepID=G0MBG2_CAEBE|nr:hypothetical protein CAEBREN_03241 [Caenorhabditis brenneri]
MNNLNDDALHALLQENQANRKLLEEKMNGIELTGLLKTSKTDLEVFEHYIQKVVNDQTRAENYEINFVNLGLILVKEPKCEQVPFLRAVFEKVVQAENQFKIFVKDLKKEAQNVRIHQQGLHDCSSRVNAIVADVIFEVRKLERKNEQLISSFAASMKYNQHIRETYYGQDCLPQAYREFLEKSLDEKKEINEHSYATALEMREKLNGVKEWMKFRAVHDVVPASPHCKLGNGLHNLDEMIRQREEWNRAIEAKYGVEAAISKGSRLFSDEVRKLLECIGGYAKQYELEDLKLMEKYDSLRKKDAEIGANLAEWMNIEIRTRQAYVKIAIIEDTIAQLNPDCRYQRVSMLKAAQFLPQSFEFD